MAQHNTLFPLVILGGALLFGSCDPMKQIVVENRTSGPLVVLLEPVDPQAVDTSSYSLGPGEERNFLLHFGKWERPSMVRDQSGRVIGAAFESDADLRAIWIEGSNGEVTVKRRFLLKNGLVVRTR